MKTRWTIREELESIVDIHFSVGIEVTVSVEFGVYNGFENSCRDSILLEMEERIKNA